MSLTTNDVRVLRLLVELGPRTRGEIAQALRFGLGSAPALRRVPKLAERGLVADVGGFYDGAADPPIDITGDGARALRAADVTAYGRFA